MHIGHRQRLRNRLLRSGGRALEDYELIELLLFNAVPRKDTKSIAKNLLVKFKSLENLFFRMLDRQEAGQSEINDSIRATILCTAEIIQRIHLNRVTTESLFDNWRNLIDYLMVLLGNREIECLYTIYVNNRNVFISDHLYEGTVDSIAIYGREIIKRAISLNASGVILAHNHPSGNAAPSDADITATQELTRSCRQLKIKIIDHVVISKNKFYSFKAEGII